MEINFLVSKIKLLPAIYNCIVLSMEKVLSVQDPEADEDLEATV